MQSSGHCHSDEYKQGFCSEDFTAGLHQGLLPMGPALVLHQDNARPHVYRETVAFLEAQKIPTLKRPPYSPDLAPADFFLFPKMKKVMRWKQLHGAVDLECTVRHVLGDIS